MPDDYFRLDTSLGGISVTRRVHTSCLASIHVDEEFGGESGLSSDAHVDLTRQQIAELVDFLTKILG